MEKGTFLLIKRIKGIKESLAQKIHLASYIEHFFENSHKMFGTQ